MNNMSETIRVLIVEDDTDLADLMGEHLTGFGYDVRSSNGRGDVMEVFRSAEPHVVLLDIGLPESNGYHWCDLIRRESKCPIFFVSGQSGEPDQILALMKGGDDFVSKPFSLDVLRAKIEAQVRRAYGSLSNESHPRIAYGDVELSPRKMSLSSGSGEVELTKTELLAARLLIENGGCVVSRTKLLSEIWDSDTFVEENTLSVVVGRLRKRLEAVGSKLGIRAIRGVGYVLEHGKADDQ